jgi:DUF1009 family protein
VFVRRVMPIMMPDTHTGPLNRRLAIVAGGGDFPLEVFHASLRQGFEPRFFALRGFSNRQISQHPASEPVDMLNPSALLASLHRFQPSGVVMAGHVSRPNPSLLLSAFSALRHQDELKQVLGEGDDHVLIRVIDLLEEQGLPVLGIDTVAPDLLCPQTVMTRSRPSPEEWVSIRTGLALLEQLSPFDCGQACIVQGQRILAIEGPEGTDATIRRVNTNKGWFRFSRQEPTSKILVKTTKTVQDRRVDLPAVGPRTIQSCRKAGLAGLALGAGSVVIIDRERMIREADQAGLFIVGVGADER